MEHPGWGGNVWAHSFRPITSDESSRKTTSRHTTLVFFAMKACLPSRRTLTKNDVDVATLNLEVGYTAHCNPAAAHA